MTSSNLLRRMARKVLPVGVRRVVRGAVTDVSEWRTNWRLARLRHKVWEAKPGSLAKCLNYTVRINDGPNFYILYKDIFIHRIYHFEAQRQDPLILDCGSNIGMSILYFKHVYPQARVIGFEPDPAIFSYLEENVVRNGLREVQLVQAALAAKEGVMAFYSDGKYGSTVEEHVPAGIPGGWKRCEASCVRLRG